MQLNIFHRTRYFYRSPVRDSYNELRLRPATEDRTRLPFFLVNVYPPARLRHFRDNFFNYVHYFELAEPHFNLTIESQSTVNTTSQYAAGIPEGVNFSELKINREEILEPFLTSSKYVKLDADVWRLALDIRNEQQEVFATARTIMEYIHEHWTYAPNSTTVSTGSHEVMQTRRGVCQDFSHIMLALCRSLGIPARYVSGYLYNGEDGTLIGAQASHAWCEVFVPGKGWFGLDPTNNTLVDERHLKIATGRDYQDAAPISGHFDGPPGASSGMEIKLSIERTGL